jgi:hypothetical protein
MKLGILFMNKSKPKNKIKIGTLKRHVMIIWMKIIMEECPSSKYSPGYSTPDTRIVMEMPAVWQNALDYNTH